jgi:SAM-dependent methyltransferase
MEIAAEVLAVLRCPECGEPLSGTAEQLACVGTERHVFASENGLLAFAQIDPGKYTPEYAKRYAALWAYGYATRHSGLDEPLYRTVASLAAEALAERQGRDAPVIVDAGCGVGRSTADCAQLAPKGTVLGFDGSPFMLELADRIVRGHAPVAIDLGDAGFPSLSIPGRGHGDVFLALADVERLPVASGCADLVLSVNIVDRLPRGPEPAFHECARVLRPGGWLVFTDPLNWLDTESWRRFEAGDVLKLLETCGFELATWFDDLWYREILDARGSFEEFRTLVVKARKTA